LLIIQYNRIDVFKALYIDVYEQELLSHLFKKKRIIISPCYNYS